MNTLKRYYSLTKPGIIFGNSVTAFGGFMLASRYSFDPYLLLVTLVGLGFVVGAGCVLNNFLDRVSDRLMPRTKHRPLAKQTVSEQGALIFGLVLLFIGGSTLALFTNLLTALIALTGFVVYVLFYSILKYKTVHGTLIGSIAGAVPPVVGYTAVANQFDLAAFLIFAIVVIWQMPHFFAIAMYRIHEYTAASIPVLPIVRGNRVTKIQMLAYVLIFMLAASSLVFFGDMGYFYLAVATLLGLGWMRLALQGFQAKNDKVWARKMFVFSLVVIMGICASIAISRLR